MKTETMKAALERCDETAMHLIKLLTDGKLEADIDLETYLKVFTHLAEMLMHGKIRIDNPCQGDTVNRMVDAAKAIKKALGKEPDGETVERITIK